MRVCVRPVRLQHLLDLAGAQWCGAVLAGALCLSLAHAPRPRHRYRGPERPPALHPIHLQNIHQTLYPQAWTWRRCGLTIAHLPFCLFVFVALALNKHRAVVRFYFFVCLQPQEAWYVYEGENDSGNKFIAVSTPNLCENKFSIFAQHQSDCCFVPPKKNASIETNFMDIHAILHPSELFLPKYQCITEMVLVQWEMSNESTQVIRCLLFWSENFPSGWHFFGHILIRGLISRDRHFWGEICCGRWKLWR